MRWADVNFPAVIGHHLPPQEVITQSDIFRAEPNSERFGFVTSEAVARDVVSVDDHAPDCALGLGAR